MKKCITFDGEAQDALPAHIKARSEQIHCCEQCWFSDFDRIPADRTVGICLNENSGMLFAGRAEKCGHYLPRTKAGYHQYECPNCKRMSWHHPDEQEGIVIGICEYCGHPIWE